MDKVIINNATLSDIGDAIREKCGTTTIYKPSEMAEAILSIETGGGGTAELPPEAFLITGDCKYRFNGWDWFLKNYGKQITTEDITSCYQMFYGSTVSNIPFSIVLDTENYGNLFGMFEGAAITTAPPIYRNELDGNNIPATNRMFANCANLTQLDNNYFSKFITQEEYEYNLKQNVDVARGSMFLGCSSLIQHPDLTRLMTGARTATNVLYNMMFYNCSALKTVLLPVSPAELTSNCFSMIVGKCSDLYSFKFETDNGVAKTAKWTNQTIDFTDKLTSYGSSSIKATLLTLPDTSTYGGTNTIKIKQGMGLTTAEIAGAAVKGWTVSYV